MKVENNMFVPLTTEDLGPTATTTAPRTIRRRRSARRRPWGPFARFCLGWLFRRMN